MVGKSQAIRTGSAVFFDRDGVLNETLIEQGRPVAPRTLADFKLVPGAAEALQKLKGLGYRLIVATNQPDLADGRIEPQTLERMHELLRSRLPLDDLFMCPHPRTAACTCRKPLPGMLLEAAGKWGIELQSSYMVGDRYSDIAAGRAAQCKTILIGSGYNEPATTLPDAVAADLAEAVQMISDNAPG